MKRFVSLTLADIRFQFRYGFYALYLFFSILYVAVIRFLPMAWRESARVLIVFSDPAALGLFFMGAIFLFEKGERVLKSLAVSPVLPEEYVSAKLVSLSLITFLSALAISLASGGSPGLPFLVGVLGASVIFSLLGVIVGSRIRSLNQFLVASVPVEIALFVPAFLYQFGADPAWLLLHPGAAVMALMRGDVGRMVPAVLSVAFWIAILFAVACAFAHVLFRDEGMEAES